MFLQHLGFNECDDDAAIALGERVRKEASEVPAKRGVYYRWTSNAGVELWLRTVDDRIIGVKPHFDGGAAMTVGISGQISQPGANLDGLLFAWAAPTDLDEPETGEYPIVFDCPDIEHHFIRFPTIAVARLVAFPTDVQAWNSRDAFLSEAGPDAATRACTPEGIEGDEVDPTPHLSLTAEVLEAEQRENPLTHVKFTWVRISTQGGDMDLVAPSDLLSPPPLGGILRARCWLAGRVEGYTPLANSGFYARTRADNESPM